MKVLISVLWSFVEALLITQVLFLDGPFTPKAIIVIMIYVVFETIWMVIEYNMKRR